MSRRRRIHRNSLAAYVSGRVDLFPDRSRKILGELERRKVPMTDRALMLVLGFSDMNAVRPRISELVAAGVLVEAGEAKDEITGKKVRTVDLAVRAGSQVSLL